MRLVLFLVLQLTGIVVFAGDSLRIGDVLQRIRYLQSHNDPYFPKGMVASYREYDWHKDVFKADDNIFYTTLLVFTLKELKPAMSAADQLLADSICQDADSLYHLFQNRKGQGTYNFWYTNPPVVFPNGGWLNLMNKSHALPDDMDDTVMILMAKEAGDSSIRLMHRYMQGFVNSGKKRKKGIRKDYRNIAAYSTWFGKRMPVDLDMCVLSNVLYMVQSNHISFTAADSASLQFICKAIDNGDYIKRASYVSPHYSRTPIILYHIARLMTAGTLPALEQRKPQLIAEARRQLNVSKSFMDKMILSTALLKWGEIPPPISETIHSGFFDTVEHADFVFFVASMTSILPDPIRQGMGKTGIGRFFYYAPAYNDILLLEYMVWYQKLQQRNQS